MGRWTFWNFSSFSLNPPGEAAAQGLVVELWERSDDEGSSRDGKPGGGVAAMVPQARGYRRTRRRLTFEAAAVFVHQEFLWAGLLGGAPLGLPVTGKFSAFLFRGPSSLALCSHLPDA